MAPEQNIRQQKLRRIILERSSEIGDFEKTKAYLRYKEMRKLNKTELAALLPWQYNGEDFDDLIDELIIQSNEEEQSNQ